MAQQSRNLLKNSAMRLNNGISRGSQPLTNLLRIARASWRDPFSTTSHISWDSCALSIGGPNAADDRARPAQGHVPFSRIDGFQLDAAGAGVSNSQLAQPRCPQDCFDHFVGEERIDGDGHVGFAIEG